MFAVWNDMIGRPWRLGRSSVLFLCLLAPVSYISAQSMEDVMEDAALDLWRDFGSNTPTGYLKS